MTKEEVLIAEIKDHLDSGAWKYEACYLNKDDLEVIVKALETVACEDAISRQALVKALEELPHEYDTKEQRARTGGIAACQVIVSEMPSVKPQEPKPGHWVHDGGKWINGWVCSECGYKLTDKQTRCCPYCGCRMESTEKGENI